MTDWHEFRLWKVLMNAEVLPVILKGFVNQYHRDAWEGQTQLTFCATDLRGALAAAESYGAQESAKYAAWCVTDEDHGVLVTRVEVVEFVGTALHAKAALEELSRG